MLMKFDFDDILLEPATITYIESRKRINLFYDNGYLPLFTAPMDTVVDYNNAHSFNSNKIGVVLPRTEKRNNIIGTDILWHSCGLDEFISEYLNETPINMVQKHILIDIANGHMEKLLLTVEQAKNKYEDQIILMVGNVANPLTYYKLSEAGADYVRLGIGNGGGCLTTQQTGIGYPMGSLIRETYQISCELKNPAKIVADGGFKKYADIIKALALGADYVMLGSIFNKAFESCGNNFIKHNDQMLTIEEYVKLYYSVYHYSEPPKSLCNDELLTLMSQGCLYKMFRGMSTKEVQKTLGNEILKTSEGVVRVHKVEYTLETWVDNFKHYLSSAMSYTGYNDIKLFIGQPNYNLITTNAYNRFNK